MAQRYILALDYADLHAQKVLRKHAKKRPLGSIESKHHYTPAQPVLSCRTVDIDVSGTRTYRPKSTADIIQEQHRLIHDIYTKTRNVSSAPNKRVWSSPGLHPEEKLKKTQTIIEVQGRPLTSKSQSPVHYAKRSKSSAKRPKTTGALKNDRSATDSNIILKADPDLLQRSKSYRELTHKIHEHWEQDSHDITQGKFVRSQKKAGSPSLDAWLTFGGDQNKESKSIVDAFAPSKSDDYYNIEGGVGSRVAEQLLKGDKIRIGINGSIQSHNLRIKTWRRETKSAPCLEKRMQPVSEHRISAKQEAPLCWEDQVMHGNAKILSPSAPQEDNQKPNLCESHPVIFRRPGESEDSASHQPKVFYPRDEGYKVKKRSKKFNIDNMGFDGKVAEIFFDHEHDDDANKLSNVSVDDIVKQTLNNKNIEKNSNKETNHIENKNDDDFSQPQDQNNMSKSFSGSQKENLNIANKTNMSETVNSTNDELARVLKVKPTPPTYSSRGPTMDLSIGPIDSPNPSKVVNDVMCTDSPKLITYYKPFSERPSPRVSPKPFYEKARQKSSALPYGLPINRPETEYLQISSQIINPHSSQKTKPEMYSTHAMTNDAIRQVQRQNKLDRSQDASQQNGNDGDIQRSISPSSSRGHILTTPSLAISIPTADDDSDRDSAVGSPSRNGQDMDDNMSPQQKREMNIRDAQIDQIASMLGEAIIGQNENGQVKRDSFQKHKKTERIKED